MWSAGSPYDQCPYDIIALVEGALPKNVARTALAEVPSIEGIEHVKTCLVHRVEGDIELTGD